MQKYEIEIDVTKIQKDRLVENEYTNKDGVKVKQTLLKATIVLNKDNVIKDFDNRTWKERGFVAESGKKDENTNILGKVTETVWKSEQSSTSTPSESASINPEDIPF